MNKRYGYELILDLEGCDKKTFNRKTIRGFYLDVCKQIKMVRGPLRFWDYKWCPWKKKHDPIHVRGISAVQFIMTSSIVLHAIDDLGLVFVDVFSCKKFNENLVKLCVIKWFGGDITNDTFINRG